MGLKSYDSSKLFLWTLQLSHLSFSIVAAKKFVLTLQLFSTEALDNDMNFPFLKYDTGAVLTANNKKKKHQKNFFH